MSGGQGPAQSSSHCQPPGSHVLSSYRPLASRPRGAARWAPTMGGPGLLALLCAPRGRGLRGGPAREVTPNSIVAPPLPGPLQHGAQEGDSALAVPGGLGILRLGWRGWGGCGWRLGASRGHRQGLWEQVRGQDATPSTVTVADLSEPTSPVQMGEPPRGCRKAPRAGGGTLSPGPGPSWRGRWVMSHVQAEGAARRRRRGARARRGAASVLLGVEGGSDERTRGRSPPRPLPARPGAGRDRNDRAGRGGCTRQPCPCF